MGIMDLLETLSGPEYDEPAPLPAEAAPELTEQPPEETAPEIPEAAPAEIPEVIPEDTPQQPPEPEAVPALPEDGYADMASLPKKKKRKNIRAEIIMGIIAAMSALLVVALTVLCWPYMTAQEDPELVPQYRPEVQASVPQETYLEPTVSETQPVKPTIPPDPNPYDRFDFQYTRHNYLKLQNLTSYAGVDVSAHQGVIDWEEVKKSGIDFAMIRLGYRGYESGKLVEDKYAIDNLEGAREAGLRVGAYFFSQALSIKEVDQEIDFMLEILGERFLEMPIVLDWEVPASSARTRNVSGQTVTDMQLHFCGIMKDKGYQPMIYFNWHQSENVYDLHALEEYPFWLALYQDRMTYPWEIEMWQWTQTGRVPGISGNVDINVYMP
ncbi:MAG: hypothetical protein IJB59_13630 [Oscillospiraceae bacterium]|nr:hypothetical protein [Oscillospiraceae bacterium]